MSLRDVCGSIYVNKLWGSQSIFVAHGCINITNTALKAKGQRISDLHFLVFFPLSFDLDPSFDYPVSPARVKARARGRRDMRAQPKNSKLS